MIANEYKVLTLAVEEGVRSGLRRYYKHRESPMPEYEQEEIAGVIEDEVTSAICGWFEFDEMGE